jgi:uncharacterized protein
VTRYRSNLRTLLAVIFVFSAALASRGQAVPAQETVDSQALLELAKEQSVGFTTVKNVKGEYVNKRVVDDGTARAAQLIAGGADINARNEFGETPLIAAVALHKIPLAKLLITKEADVNAALDEKHGDDAGATALMIAASEGETDIVPLLISKGAKVNAATKVGRTALQSAVLNHERAMVALLLRNNADASSKDGDGKTALQLAQEKKFADIVLLLSSPAKQPVRAVPAPKP